MLSCYVPPFALPTYHSTPGAAWDVGALERYRTTQGCRRTSERGIRFSGSYCKSCDKRDQDQGPSEVGRGEKRGETQSRGGLNKQRTFVIKSRASAETFDGIRRSTFAIRLYVAGTRHQRTPVSTRAPGRMGKRNKKDKPLYPDISSNGGEPTINSYVSTPSAQ